MRAIPQEVVFQLEGKVESESGKWKLLLSPGHELGPTPEDAEKMSRLKRWVSIV